MGNTGFFRKHQSEPLKGSQAANAGGDYAIQIVLQVLYYILRALRKNCFEPLIHDFLNFQF